MPRIYRYVLAVIAAGVVGLIVNSIAVAATFEGGSFIDLVAAPGRIVVALAAAAMLPPIHRRFPFIIEDVIAIAALTVVPTVLAKWVFDLGLEWSEALAFNAVYAAAALLTYRFAAEWGREVND